MAKNYTLLSPDKKSIIEISNLGAQILSYKINGNPVLHEDPINQRRCGIPILFPFAGALKDNVFSLSHTKLTQHGFGRDVNWDVYQVIEKEEYNVITFALSYSDLPEIWQNNYPFPFIVMVHYYLSDTSLDLDLVVMNPLQEELQVPVRPGFHPYFHATIEDKKSIKLSHSQAQYNKINWEKATKSIFLDSKHKEPFKFTINDKQFKTSIVERIFRLSDDSDEIELDMNNKIVIWAEPESDFICIEPISGPFNSINYNPILIQKGQGYQFRYKIEVTIK